MPTEVDYLEMAEEQQTDQDLQKFIKSTTSCKFKTLNWGETQTPIIFETSTGNKRP